jgi:hypothetical protein
MSSFEFAPVFFAFRIMPFCVRHLFYLNPVPKPSTRTLSFLTLQITLMSFFFPVNSPSWNSKARSSLETDHLLPTQPHGQGSKRIQTVRNAGKKVRADLEFSVSYWGPAGSCDTPKFWKGLKIEPPPVQTIHPLSTCFLWVWRRPLSYVRWHMPKLHKFIFNLFDSDKN